MKTPAAVNEQKAKAMKSPAGDLVKRAEKLLADLKTADDFGQSKSAILRFLTALDGRSKAGLGVLGDMDFAILFLDSLERRGKTQIAPILLNAAAVFRTQRPPDGKEDGKRGKQGR